ncbi:MAG TPA: hypothetical protein VNK94_13445 [Gaiellaceae bacterium]|jgi:hypothetical protein|nr:hypothetical protein [Gaiellaceae bacterium]
MRATIVCLVAALSSLALGATAGTSSAGPRPCILMDRLVRSVLLSETEFTATARGGALCRWASKPAKGTVTSTHQVLLNVFHETSAANARNDYQFLTKRNCSRIRVRGADAACANAVDLGKASSTRIVWLCGTYMGWLAEVGPGHFASLDEVRDDLASFLARMPC